MTVNLNDAMPLVTVESLDDPRLAPYRAIKERELAKGGGRFIAEGEHVVRRLLESGYETESVLLAARRVDEIVPIVPPQVPVYAVPDEMVERVIGFKFHSGVIACGLRGERRTIDDLVLGSPGAPGLMLVICPEIANAENMGAMIRVCAAFGADALLLGERSCDPFWRQSIRVSMGTVFKLPLVQSDDLLRDVKRLKQEWGVELVSTVLDESAEPLSRATRAAKLGLLFGNEAQGLEQRYVDACDRRVTIPMKLGTDSLNVAVSAGIMLYHFTR
jgi:tRNA G18 (ribose-2'-O)-methylase SpoU